MLHPPTRPQKRMCTFVPCALHALHRVYRVRNARARAFHTVRAERSSGRRVGDRLSRSVRGLGTVDLADPGTHAATDMDRIGQPGSVEERQYLCRSHPGLAIEHDLLIVR